MREENQLGNMLTSFRKRKGGWNQEQTAVWLGVARHTYSDWETGKRFPSPEKLKYIATKLELSQEEEEYAVPCGSASASENTQLTTT